MTDNKKATGVGEPQAASKSLNESYITLIGYRIKTMIYRLAPWLCFMGVLHG
jgi:hypothetical protein